MPGDKKMVKKEKENKTPKTENEVREEEKQRFKM